MFELKCLTCIHGEVCAYKHGGVDLSIISGDCKYYKPTADVVPKSEIKCAYAYDGEVEEYCPQSPCGNYKMVEQIKSEVEKWKEINEQLHKEMSERILEERKIERKLVAREIFEEMQSCLIQRHWNGLDIVSFEFDAVKYAELKKKYTESEDKE